MKKKASMKVRAALKKRRAKVAMDAVQASLDLFNDMVKDEAPETEPKDDGGADGEELPDGVTVTQEGDDSVRFSFNFKYSPNKYDSTVDKGGNEHAVDTVEESVSDAETGGEPSAQDAYPVQKGPENAVASASAQCKATFEECKAKNPYACKYHGQKLMEADIYALLAAKGAKSAKVKLNQLSPGAYEADVTCINTPAEKKAALAAIKAFLKKQGIDQTSVVDADYDKKEKMATAFFDVDNLDPKAESEKEMHAPPPKEVVAKAEKSDADEKPEEKVDEEVKDTTEVEEQHKPSANGGTGITDEEFLASLKKVFGDKIKFDIGSSDFEMWKTAITDGVTDGMQLSDTNKGYLQKMVDELPDGDPVANVAAATLAKLNAETGKATAGNPKKAKKPKEEPKQHAETTETAKNANEEDDASVKSPDADEGGYSTEKFIALKNEGLKVGADKDAAVTAKMQEVAAHVADMKKAEQTMDELSKAIGKMKDDPDLSDETKDIIKNALSKEFTKANEEYAKASKEAGTALSEFKHAIEKFKAEKEKKAHLDAVEKVKKDVESVLPIKNGHITSAAIVKVNGKIDDSKDKCEMNGLDAGSILESSGVSLAALNAKSNASAYSSAVKDFDSLNGSDVPDADGLAEASKKAVENGNATIGSLKKFDEAVKKAEEMMKEQIEAKAAQTQASAPSASAMPTEKKAAVKAKIAAMTPKEKAAKAIEILKKKIAADPGNAEYKAKLAKFEALAAKLG